MKPTAIETDFAAMVQAQNTDTLSHLFSGEPLVRAPIAEQVSGRILAMIKSGNLKSGDKLPTEQQMCLAFGISRPPLREALKSLALIGVLNSRQGGRYVITDLTPSRLVTPFNVMLSVAEHDLKVQFEARAVIELELVRFCTERASKEQRERIMELARDGHAFRDDPVGFRLLDVEYHQAINAGADNSILATLSEGLYNVAIDARRVASTKPGVIAISIQQHCHVAQAISAGDAEQAVKAYEQHLIHVRDTTISAIDELPGTLND